ncbi:hypothetical protein C1922_19005 [Stenotrophomonas sp. ZAC14D2_NAIMI4_7]|uniref:hypothetical protein n=1 Tax=Stenotrophomonas sp. ZAC14D2_NAIMI4_7 TaxID=2072405 RepID=UPI000D53D91E|nr:hypothetical protein [Stenotrophomonas sp. ZAC14D2_NAIMI4_7]AWH19253.1 hypothetical protein C1922_19005 [Stenotrophomonas sp. ZAC14D2_NAIMI4_7]
MAMILALVLLAPLLPLALLVLMWRRAPRWQGNPWLYRAGFAFLAALLSPTLLMAGHGGLPCPTFGGLILVFMRLEWIGDLQLNLIAFGSKDAAILSAPFLVVFAAAMLIPLRTARRASLTLE